MSAGTIEVRCPNCGRVGLRPRLDDVPAGAALVIATCCGGDAEPIYRDVQGGTDLISVATVDRLTRRNPEHLDAWRFR